MLPGLKMGAQRGEISHFSWNATVSCFFKVELNAKPAEKMALLGKKCMRWYVGNWEPFCEYGFPDRK